MDKRYQVFISSTFQDLQNARKEVSQALLRADCFPAGMELFPAADEEQFAFIKSIIDQSDYYIIISAGRYGSIHPETGLSYTEMEYDYAVEIGKPVIRLLHKDPFNELKGEFIEKTVKGRKALEKFRGKMSNSSLVNHWEETKDLGHLVLSNLMDAMRRYPASGWVKGDNALTVETLKELNDLRNSKAHLKQTETVVNFDDREGDSEIRIMVSKRGEDEKHKVFASSRIPNKLVAKQIFLALLNDNYVTDIGQTASDAFTETFEFSKAALKWDHRWLEFDCQTVKNCLLYLESRGLARCTVQGLSIVPEQWDTTPKGRQQAVFIKANQEFR